MVNSSRGTLKDVVDLSFADSRGNEWWYPVRVPIKAGATYQITIWYVEPGIEFELQTSLQPT